MPGTGPTYDTATNTFRQPKPLPLPLRKERKQLPGGFSRPLKPASFRPQVSTPKAPKTLGQAQLGSDPTKFLPPE